MEFQRQVGQCLFQYISIYINMLPHVEYVDYPKLTIEEAPDDNVHYDFLSILSV